MTVAVRMEALTGIWYVGLTFIQNRENGRVSSRLTAHIVREVVVKPQTIPPKKHTMNMANSTVAPALLPVAW